MSQHTVAAWRHLAASGFPTPSRWCATTTVTALHCLFVCLFGSFVYCLTELFLLRYSTQIILLAALFFQGLFQNFPSSFFWVLTVPVGALVPWEAVASVSAREVMPGGWLAGCVLLPQPHWLLTCLALHPCLLLAPRCH